MAVDINEAIDAYSDSFGNQPERLRRLCSGDLSVTEAIAKEIAALQEGIIDRIRFESGPSGLSRTRIEQLARQYVAVASPEVNEVGLRGLLRYVIWIAWHDGWLELNQ